MVKPHGNCRKKKVAFCRTMPSTLLSLKKEASIHTPKAAVDVVYTEQGGIINAASSGQLPRNFQQVSNIRRQVACKQNISCTKDKYDPLFMVMEQSKLCETEEKFVRIVTASPEPMCILATDTQLLDLFRFATEPTNHSVVCIDPTFSLGNFSVTCLALRNLLVTDPRTGESPIILGPILVHQRKLFETYHFFAASLVSLCQDVSKLLAFGTDGEENLIKAFCQQFPKAIHLRCFRHMKGDIKRKLTNDFKLPDSVATEILNDIFGFRVGPNFQEGLVDSNSEDELFEKLSLVKDKWKRIEDDNKCTSSTSFHEWFLKYHAKEFVDSMLKPVRTAAGLGDPPAEFNTNDSESTNSAVKQFLQFKKSDWPTFNEKIKKYIVLQQEEIDKSIVGIGQYVLKPEFQHLAIAPRKWFTSFTEKQKLSAQEKFHKTSVCSPSSSNCKSLSNTSGSRQGENRECALQVEQSSQVELSVTVMSASEITQLPFLTLKQMWGKAKELLSDAGKICPAPGCSPKSRMVASFSQTKPHYVSVNSDGRFECDDKCPAFKQRQICSHCIATAEDNKELVEFLKSYYNYSSTPKGQLKTTPNLLLCQ